MESQNSVKINIDQDLWVIRVRESLQIVEEIDEEQENSICVFNMPKELLVQKPDAYIPQSVSIGPYHHWRSDLYEMERYKLAAARRLQKRIAAQKLEAVVEEFRKFDRHIRSYYHKYIDYKEEALAWFMALDASFLLQCLQFYVKQSDPTSSEDWSEVKKLWKVLDPSGSSAVHNKTLRDLMMLENQKKKMFFTRYTDFMNGIIDKEEDVRLLTTSGIIYNHMESDGKVASLWNGMGKCVKLTKLRYLDEVIAEVNDYYNRRYRKRIGALRALSVIAVVMFLLLTGLQALCSVYDCKKWFMDTNFIQL